LSPWSADLNLDHRDLVSAYSRISVDATVRTVRLNAVKIAGVGTRQRLVALVLGAVGREQVRGLVRKLLETHGATYRSGP